MSAADVVTVYADCHAYAWHEVDPYFPECGPDNLVRMAEEYGALVERVTEDSQLPQCFRGWLDWAWWYKITGPRDNVVRLLTVEYAGEDETLALEMVGTAADYADE